MLLWNDILILFTRSHGGFEKFLSWIYLLDLCYFFTSKFALMEMDDGPLKLLNRKSCNASDYAMGSLFVNQLFWNRTYHTYKSLNEIYLVVVLRRFNKFLSFNSSNKISMDFHSNASLSICLSAILFCFSIFVHFNFDWFYDMHWHVFQMIIFCWLFNVFM